MGLRVGGCRLTVRSSTLNRKVYSSWVRASSSMEYSLGGVYPSLLVFGVCLSSFIIITVSKAGKAMSGRSGVNALHHMESS